MIDIHSHILNNVDDGSQSFEMSLKMIEKEVSDSVSTVILTPHFAHPRKTKFTKKELEEKFKDFKQKVSHLPIEFIFGAEIYYSNKLGTQFKKDDIITLNNSNYILLEFSLVNESMVVDILHDIQVNGYKIILAHPERYTYLSYNDILEASKVKNVKLQINASSILGLNGRKAKKTVFKMMKQDIVDFVASDAHNLERCPNLLEAKKIVEKKFSVSYAEKIFVQNQEQLLKDIDCEEI